MGIITFAYTDWQINILMFQNKIKAFYLRADTKILASQMSLKFLYYVSQNPNPCVLAIDVFIYINEETKFSWFPSFKLTGKCISKIQNEEASTIMVIL